MNSTTSYRILVIGDFHFGESYRQAGAKSLASHGYQHSTKYLKTFRDATDKFILNLETPLASDKGRNAPLRGRKSYLHWADAGKTAQALVNLRADAVSLANNHTMDLGVAGLESTFDTLAEYGIKWFGAGNNRAEAEVPYSVEIPASHGGGEILFRGCFQYSRVYDKKFGFFAGEDSSGCAPLNEDEIQNVGRNAGKADTLRVAFPHWGRNYTWVDDRQKRLSAAVRHAGYDLIIGHGSHALQELSVEEGRLVAYGIGNGNFMSGGRWEKYAESTGVLPYSFWSVLEVQQGVSQERRVVLRLYPVRSDNRKTDFQPKPATEEEFNHIHAVLSMREGYAQRYVSLQNDELGYHFEVPFASWYVGEEPRTVLAAADGSSGQLKTDNELSTTVEGSQGQPQTSRESVQLSSSVANDFGDSPLLTLPKSAVEGAGIEGAALSKRLKVTRYNRTVFTAEDQNGRQIGFRRSWSTHSSVVGSEACADKAICKALLQINGIPTAVGAKMPRRGSVSAAKFVAKHDWPVVVKPLKGSGGRGVTADIRNFEDLRAAIREADSPSGFLIEKHVPGDDYRFLVLGDEVIGVWKRDAANIVGDGRATVGELIDKKNAIRSKNPHLFTRLIQKDTLVQNHLKRISLDLDSIVPIGEKVYLRSAANLSAGGDNIELTDETHVSLKEIAVRARQALPGIQLVGVDMLIQDHAKPASRQTVNICEINSQPGISAHEYPMFGPPRDASLEYVEYLIFKEGLLDLGHTAEGAYEVAFVGTFEVGELKDSIRALANDFRLMLRFEVCSSDLFKFRVEGTSLATAVLNIHCAALPARVGQMTFSQITPL